MRIDLVLTMVLIASAMWAMGGLSMAGDLANATERDLDLVRSRLLASLVDVSESRGKTLAESAERWLRDMRDDGSWADQDYADTDRERWKCGGHLPRVLDFATAARTKHVPAADQARYLEAAVRSLRFWLDSDPKNTNWWHNEIGVPLQVGNALILLGEDVSPDIRDRGVELMKRSRWSTWTGQNLVWGTRIQIIRSCVAGDVAAAAEAFGRMYEEVRINPGRAEGVKPDWSFYQHGELLYSGGYGAGFTSDTSRLALLARDTAFAIPPEKLEIIVHHLLDGQAWMTRGHFWDYSVTGREIVRNNKAARSLATPARDLALLYPKRSDELLALAARLSDAPDAKALSGNRHFWYSDYMAHQRPDWSASVRMYSTRTKNTDPLINGENRKSHFLAEGATYIMLGGGEYENIFPVWDWHKIPGTTIEQGTPFDLKTIARVGKEPFVGGASDGTYGCATMDLSTGQLRAKKSWFLFDDAIVALGAGISCDSDNSVATTINQCLGTGELVSTDPRWFWHGQIGYVNPGEQPIHVAKGKQQGSWHSIASGTREERVERDVMLAFIDHGVRPADAAYSYLVLPASSVERTAAAAETSPVKVLSNTPALQAVYHQQLGMTQAIFREAGSVECGSLRVGVDRPCALIIKRQGDELSITAANPLNEPLELNLVVNVAVETPGATRQSDGTVAIKLALPGGNDSGKSVTLNARIRE